MYKEDQSVQSWMAVSGVLRNGETNPDAQARKDYGPLPEDTYIVNPNETKSGRTAENGFDLFKWFIKSRDWGLFVTPIHSLDGTQNYKYGRHGAFIHGGWNPGSAGCIDLTKDNYYFHMELEKIKTKIYLIIDYDRLRK